ncbi:MAG: PQQ-binding-like beta-propeller repeat protein [Gemmataceae bacterium]|nr:PQQ-binding-like beta-propeller repeat protein [Gemmataceae bacterium]MCI0641611.1 PQQ-binding-like beta-propeller repeat protein [Gemmataceae bacterium]MCI0742370.1 PQQ-binding-like beta-propeller repeat protein [Gemmataceae bacterium]
MNVRAVFVLGLFAASWAGLAFWESQLRAQNTGKPKPVQPNEEQWQAPNIAPPAAFQSKEGKKGWKVVIPGDRPLATPAVVGGKVFVGGGFGSHEFYAFGAVSGKKLWVYQTGDDGPTAAVVADGCVAFNTESCELEIITMEGKRLWKKWLGDPLMSMPAIHKGRVYMAYPGKDNKNYLACFDLKTGAERWQKPISAEIITAPVLADGRVFVATLDGTLSCFEVGNGKPVWSEKQNATSSPVVWQGHSYFSRRVETTVEEKGKKVAQQLEQLARRGTQASDKVRDLKATQRPADYLDVAKRGAHSTLEMKLQGLDAGVGFANVGGGGANLAMAAGFAGFSTGNLGGALGGQAAGFPPTLPQAGPTQLLQSAAMASLKANSGAGFAGFAGAIGGLPAGTGNFGQLGGAGSFNTGQLSVSGVWSYQGSRPFVANGRLYSAMGDTLKCIDPQTEKVLWKAVLGGAKKNQPLVDATVTPPALVNGKVFVGTTHGEILCFAADTGKELWRATIGQPILFQPAVAHGRVYVSTSNGHLYAIETGDARDHGWLMWGGNPAHNGLNEK